MTQVSEHRARSSSVIIVLVFVAGLLVGGVAVGYFAFLQINSLRGEVSKLRNQVSQLWGFQNVTNQNITLYQDNVSLTELYAKVRDSVVLIYGTTSTTSVQGSGFVYDFNGTNYVITNYHVIHDTISRSATFSDGNGYAATIVGTDAYADLAILSVNAPPDKFKPLEMVSSSMLKVGDSVIAIGNPYGLVGSMTTGVVSALGRSISEEYTGGFSIANIIQTSAPINPGNSGGPLLNYMGKVVGITTAIITDSQGLGFAVPSNTIMREINSLVTSGSYRGHSYLGLNGTDMYYETAQQQGVSVTYGWRVMNVRFGGPSYGKLSIDDIIVAMNGTTIKNHDNLASYLEEHTMPTDTVEIEVYRKESGTWTQKTVPVVLGERP